MRERKHNRLKGFDYASSGIYFLTICCKDRSHWLGRINNNRMELNEHGIIVEQQIKWLEQQYFYFVLHNFVIMPNHVHILAEIAHGRTDRSRPVPIPQKIKSISELMGAFKTTSSKKIHLAGNDNFQWQRSFHDHIVKSGESYKRIHTYINLNPAKWDDDQLNNFGNNEQ